MDAELKRVDVCGWWCRVGGCGEGEESWCLKEDERLMKATGNQALLWLRHRRRHADTHVREPSRRFRPQ
jgi:hypothetical protein